MPHILLVSDSGTSSGYGRIADEVGIRLHRRGYRITAASLGYDGLLPPLQDGQPLPYWVASLAGRPWVENVTAIVNAIQPDIVLVAQDAPYIEAIRNASIDWSRYRLIGITPVDGVPIYPRWVEVMRACDAALTISAYGQTAYRQAGVNMRLCRPGVDPNKFFRKTDDERVQLRAKLGLDMTHFIVGTVAMNQGRKAISAMLTAFFRFAADKPNARYLLDMEAVSPAGWDIPALCQQYGWDARKLIFRADAIRAGLTSLADRYNLMNAHMVVSHREGYGLPLAEAMACGVVSIALDYCSGTEIVGEGRGILIPAIDYAEAGTWGGAEDRFPDMAALVKSLNWLYENHDERRAMAARGMAWAKAQTWDMAADAVQAAIDEVMRPRVAPPAAPAPADPAPPVPPAPPVIVPGALMFGSSSDAQT